jgi:hypothetical protein
MLSAIAGAVTIWFVVATVAALGIGALMHARHEPEMELATQRSWSREHAARN